MNIATGKLCSIRNWQFRDKHSLFHHANNINIWRNLRDTFPHPYTTRNAKQWIETQHKSKTNFAIDVNNEAVGGIGILLQKDVYKQSAEIGYWLGEDYWGRGIATEAVKMMTHHAFNNFDICRIYAVIFDYNTTSIRVLEKADYVFEAKLKKAVIKDGRIIDQYIYSIIR